VTNEVFQVEIKISMASEGAIDLKAKASGLIQERTAYALSGWQLSYFEIHVKTQGFGKCRFMSNATDRGYWV